MNFSRHRNFFPLRRKIAPSHRCDLIAGALLAARQEIAFRDARRFCRHPYVRARTDVTGQPSAIRSQRFSIAVDLAAAITNVVSNCRSKMRIVHFHFSSVIRMTVKSRTRVKSRSRDLPPRPPSSSRPRCDAFDGFVDASRDSWVVRSPENRDRDIDNTSTIRARERWHFHITSGFIKKETHRSRREILIGRCRRSKWVDSASNGIGFAVDKLAKRVLFTTRISDLALFCVRRILMKNNPCWSMFIN